MYEGSQVFFVYCRGIGNGSEEILPQQLDELRGVYSDEDNCSIGRREMEQ